jgi:hypothetical protein
MNRVSATVTVVEMSLEQQRGKDNVIFITPIVKFMPMCIFKCEDRLGKMPSLNRRNFLMVRKTEAGDNSLLNSTYLNVLQMTNFAQAFL